MIRILQIIAIAFFVVVSLIVIVPSVQLVFRPDAEIGRQVPAPPDPPLMPNPPELNAAAGSSERDTLVKLYADRVTAYTQSVTAYGSQVTAYGRLVDATTRAAGTKATAGRSAAYELVVKGTLVPILEKILATFLAFAFVKVGWTVMDNYNKMKKGHPPSPLALW